MISIRKIGVLGRTYRHLNRYRQILGVLFKYGFGDLIETLRIEQYIEIGLQMISRKRRDRLEKLTRAERIRMALEELGPTYIKLGQVLSTRPDLVTVDFINEFSKLQDKVPAFGFDAFTKTIASEMGRPHELIFETLDPRPRSDRCTVPACTMGMKWWSRSSGPGYRESSRSIWKSCFIWPP